jgi:parallel beta-helix repeat protein
MEKHLIKKALVFTVIILFIFMSITPSSAVDNVKKSTIPFSNGNTLYVGGSGPGNYSTIQGAINDASNGDTIFVYMGNYSVFTANKNITIIGENREKTIVKANEITLNANGINLTNFTLRGTIQTLDNVLVIRGSYCHISYCTIIPSSSTDGPLNGIEIGWCSYTTISNCEIKNFWYWGITCRVIKNCYFENCTINNLYRGFYVLGDGCENNHIVNCEFLNCGWDSSIDGAAILMHGSNYLFIKDCNIHNNTRGVEMSGTDHNTIIGCNIHDNKIGVLINARCFSGKNIIIENYFYHNQKGVMINIDSYDNYVYHNNFINNSQNNAWDKCNNNWDDDHSSGGNYWSDYVGEDNNYDGIGDTPYEINTNGNINWDRFPLMEPFGNFRINNNGPYYDFINNTIQFKSLVFGGTPPYNYYWDFGDGNISTEQNPIHVYTNVDNYPLYLSITDNNGNTSNHTSWTWIQETNNEPDKPIIEGTTKGVVGISYQYNISSSDSDKSSIYYYINWGDGTKPYWIGPYDSGIQINCSHIWNEKRTYIIVIKAKDPYNAESLPATLQITMPRNKTRYSTLFFRFLKQFPLLKNLIFNNL